jgi:type IV pilus assembly protein PilW
MRSKTSALHRESGFSLIELMIGMTIGLIAAAVIIQVMSFFEAQRRSTTGTADAQTNGGIAMYSISREAQMAGFSLLPSTDSPLECVTLTDPGATGMAISPVSITDGVAASGVSASDSITIRYGLSDTGGAGTQIDSLAVGPPAVATVKSSLGCVSGDAVLVSNGPSCMITTATGVSATPITVTLANAAGVSAGSNLACLGKWREVTYAVNPATGNLDRTERVNGALVATPVTSVVGVVNLQAQYGISAAANSNQVVQWVDASGGTWAAPTLANRNRIKAIRIAVVARNPKIELETVTAACSALDSANPTGLCAWGGTSTSPAPAIDLSPGDPNWARYRYRVFETIIPLRNMIWSKDTL